MPRIVNLLGAFMTFIAAAAIAQTANTARVPSGIGNLNLNLMHVAASGPQRGRSVLFIQGATFPSANASGWKFNGRSWMDEVASAGYEVYALDFLGYGASDRFPELDNDSPAGNPLGDVASMVRQIEAACDYIRRVQSIKTVNIVAHSAGSFAAARFAQWHADRVDRLVLFAAPVPYETPTGGTAGPPVRYVEVGREDQLHGFESQVRDTRQLDPEMFDTWIQAYLATDARSASKTPPSVRVPAGMLAALEDVQRTGQLPYDPAKIVVPTLLIQGEWDVVAPPAAGLWLYSRLASPLKRFVLISQAGHRAHLERNRWQLYRETEGFLNGGDTAR